MNINENRRYSRKIFQSNSWEDTTGLPAFSIDQHINFNTTFDTLRCSLRRFYLFFRFQRRRGKYKPVDKHRQHFTGVVLHLLNEEFKYRGIRGAECSLQETLNLKLRWICKEVLVEGGEYLTPLSR